MDMLAGILMLLVYVAIVAFIIKGESPIISLLVLAILWAMLAGVPGKDILAQILEKGGTAYASAIVIIVFGAWFGQALVKTGTGCWARRAMHGSSTAQTRSIRVTRRTSGCSILWTSWPR
jgi:hypothetical protein